jgi:hypothetical protein
LWVLGIHIGTMPDKPVTISMVNGNHSQVSATTIAPSAVSGLAISECSGSPIVASARCDGQPRPGLRRRFLVPGAHAMATGFGIEHKVQVVTMLSKTTLAKGSCSAEALTSDTGTGTSAILFLANRSSSTRNRLRKRGRPPTRRAAGSGLNPPRSPARHRLLP